MHGSDRKLETMVGGGAFFESPRWHDGRLWVSDYWGYQVLAIAPDGATETVAQVPGAPSGLGWLPDDTLLVVSMQDTKLLRVENGSTMVHADLSAHSGPQANDMVIDAAGRAMSAPSTSRPSPTWRPPTWSGWIPTDRCRWPPPACCSPTGR